ncbi:VOC family protein [Mycobacterium sp. MYCO198283]|uniref:VOC family protein n=1 Tax=Mycobacterium sp. MYCO198283 TaxID=2883505 RepID=UPI001E645E8F|nr:VOC family protein [Mycobacterium sp. MYCO198283]MCG5433320.1 VOC family protein [Mycobacterium sp. MYCO198283]
MASGVSTVWLPVDDMDRAVKFYGETLGLKVTSQSDDWTELDANGLTIGLNAREETHQGRGGGAVITFQPENDMYHEVERLTDAGIEFEVSQHPWGRIAAFKDSEGNDLQFYEAPQLG